jgi:excisionase family DNA binding protein
MSAWHTSNGSLESRITEEEQKKQANTEIKPPKLLLTISEAAQALNLIRSLMYDLVLSGQVASLKIGRTRRIPWKALQMFIDQNTTR